MNKWNIYDIFYEKWNHGGTVWLYSDPHFHDKEIEDIRKITAEDQIKRINSKVTKNDTIIFLGDIGDLECIKQIHGYKVLVTGNHDAGASTYLKKPVNITSLQDELRKYPEVMEKLIKTQENCEIDDDKLFDEVYDGPVWINSKIVLSHEPFLDSRILNIHGHDHSGSAFVNLLLKNFDADISLENLFAAQLETIKLNNLQEINICAEWTNYYPVTLKAIMHSGILKNINDIHRVTIDKASVKTRRI